MDFRLFTDLFQHTDTVTSTFATDVSGRVITAVMPVISAGLTLSFIFYGLLVARGAVEHSVKDFVWKCLKISIIVSIASAARAAWRTAGVLLVTPPSRAIKGD